ncbi:hypothetical protein [Acidicapsa acidisoli]|uniref:hypothetical protein n=1 Tax=Acidicapsa acidisoli TaxID=1615681 RepID=UPI0021DFF44E|nr:hypothetical protein [Acidicapsa acidisoli]
MANDSNDEIYRQDISSARKVSKVLGLGFVSAASAIAGGLAVAWWYRKTLTKLQNPIVSVNHPQPEFEKSDRESAERETAPLESQD